MDLGTRQLIDRYFTGLGLIAILLMVLALVVILGPIFLTGAGAVVFRETVNRRVLHLEIFNRGNPERVTEEWVAVQGERQEVYDRLNAFNSELMKMKFSDRQQYRSDFAQTQNAVEEILGPEMEPGTMPADLLSRRPLTHERYGETRWDKTQEALHRLKYKTKWVSVDPSKPMKKTFVPRAETFAGTSLESFFPWFEENLDRFLRPSWTVYWRYWFMNSDDGFRYGGIWDEMLGTIYLTVGAILFSVPIGVISAIFLVEFAREGWLVSTLRMCISSLAGVPSVVFGLFGFAFFIATIQVSENRSVLAGSLTLALLVLPTIIRASEEAIRAVPHTFKEASLSLGAGKWRTILTVILPAALPGVLTGIVISMGRAAGETAPIIFTAAVSQGSTPWGWDFLGESTKCLPFSAYYLATAPAHGSEINYMRYGMVTTLVTVVLLLNATAIILRAHIQRKLRG